MKNQGKPGKPASEAGERRRVTVELSGEALRLIEELGPAVTMWAANEMGEEMTSPADVIELAIHCLHAQVFAAAIEKARQERESETAH